MSNKENTTQHKSKRGFASMPEEKVKAIAHEGGRARAEQEGHEGMSRLGKKGGDTRAEQEGPEGMAALGRKGGQISGAHRKKR